MAIIGSAEVEVRAKLDKFDDDIRKGTTQAGAAFGKFDSIVGKAEGSLKKLGLTSQDLAIILGAGLAGGAAFAIREVLRFGASVVEAASALQEQASASKAVFEANSDMVASFAEGADALGLSEAAALKATTTFGGFFQNIGLGTEASAKLAIGFTALAADAASFFDIDPEQAQERIISGLRGESDAVERLNVNISESVVTDRAMREGFGKTADEISLGEKVFTRAIIIREGLDKATGDILRTSDSLANSQRRLNAEYENSKAALGEALLPAVNFVTKAMTDLLETLPIAIAGFDDLNDEFDSFLGFPIRKLGDGVGIGDQLHDVLFGPPGEENLGDTSDEIGAAVDELADKENRAAIAAEKFADETDKIADAHRRLERALGDAERKVDRAETTLARAFEDSELRIDKAERNLAEAFEDRSERISDAEKQLANERLQAFRSVRDAREALTDFERESAQRVEDAQRNLDQARRQRVKSIQDARFALEAALRAGDAEAENEARRRLKDAASSEQVASAERALAEAKAERDRQTARLERELAETRVDAARQVEDAQIRLARTYDDTAERIEEAQRGIRDAHRESARSIADAQRGLEDAMRDSTESVDDARRALDKYADSAEKARTAQQLLNKELGLIPDLIIGEVNPNVGNAGRAAGGPVVAGGWNVVGEQGPELVKWGASGTVVSNDDIVTALNGIGGRMGGPVTVIVNHNDPVVFANALSYELAKMVNP